METSIQRNIPIIPQPSHIHLSEPDFKILFGSKAEAVAPQANIEPLYLLRGMESFLTGKSLLLASPQASIANVRVIGPYRERTQVEISLAEAKILGLQPPLRKSGDLANSEKITLVGPAGTLELSEGLIIPQRHVHLDAKIFKNFSIIEHLECSIKVAGARSGILEHVLIRTTSSGKSQIHLDLDEARALGIAVAPQAYSDQGLGDLIIPLEYIENFDKKKSAETSFRKDVDKGYLSNKSNKPLLITERDVRDAIKSGQKITLKKGDIITPAARDLAKEYGIIQE